MEWGLRSVDGDMVVLSRKLAQLSDLQRVVVYAPLLLPSGIVEAKKVLDPAFVAKCVPRPEVKGQDYSSKADDEKTLQPEAQEHGQSA